MVFPNVSCVLPLECPEGKNNPKIWDFDPFHPQNRLVYIIQLF